jgi:peptidoglycan hydrolase-like protein with peptidoglycan-binding domain
MKKTIVLLLLAALILAPVAGSRVYSESITTAPDAATTPADNTPAPETSPVPPVVPATPEEMLANWYMLGALLRANGSYPFVVLQRGDKGYEVVALQERLAQLNFYAKGVSPVFGNGTYLAMRRFEAVNHLKVNGIASAEDQILLFGPDALPETGTTIRPVTPTPAPAVSTPAPNATSTPDIDVTTAPTPVDNG